MQTRPFIINVQSTPLNPKCISGCKVQVLRIHSPCSALLVSMVGVCNYPRSPVVVRKPLMNETEYVGMPGLSYWLEEQMLVCVNKIPESLLFICAKFKFIVICPCSWPVLIKQYTNLKGLEHLNISSSSLPFSKLSRGQTSGGKYITLQAFSRRSYPERRTLKCKTVPGTSELKNPRGKVQF